MPLVPQKTYSPPFWLFNKHLETIYPALFRKISMPSPPVKVTIPTPDHDYLDLDYYDNESKKTVIISHGLEGNSERAYVLGMAKKFFNKGWNVVAWNYRGCNGKVNNTLKFYHSGFTEDLEIVIQYAKSHGVEIIALVGFSLGGNLTLKYLGQNDSVDPAVKCAVTFSVPLELHHGCLEISKPSNFIYAKRFLKSLKSKITAKAKKFTEISTHNLSEIHDLISFDDRYTAPIHGFKDALDYYKSSSSLYILEDIQKPALIVNAKNDPFLPPTCYPVEKIKDHPFVHLETPERGGHVGFCSVHKNEHYWSEDRAYAFVESMI